MSEGIDYEQLGTIIVSFDDKTYTLTRPKMGQWRYFSRKLQGLYDENREKLLALTEDAQKEGPKQAKAQAALREYQIQPFYESTIPWLRKCSSSLEIRNSPNLRMTGRSGWLLTCRCRLRSSLIGGQTQKLLGRRASRPRSDMAHPPRRNLSGG